MSRRIGPQRGQERLPGFPKPEGMLGARAAIEGAPERPVYGPERPADATLGLYRNRMLQRRQFQP